MANIMAKKFSKYGACGGMYTFHKYVSLYIKYKAINKTGVGTAKYHFGTIKYVNKKKIAE